MKWLALMLGLWLAFPAWAAVAVYPFDTPEQEARFHHLVTELRCPKCQNQNLADSDAPIAKDLKDKVYQKIQQGESNQQIIDYLVARYGDFITYRPPFNASTLLLWLTPIAVLLLGLGLLIRRARRPKPELSVEQQQRLQQLLRDYQQDSKHD